MARKKTEYIVNPDWTIFETYSHNKDVIAEGDKVKIKFERGEFKFWRHVINSKTKTEWIDCYGETGYRSFYPESLKGKVKPKKFRKKKNVV
jgi:hypothetical protein